MGYIKTNHKDKLELVVDIAKNRVVDDTEKPEATTDVSQ